MNKRWIGMILILVLACPLWAGATDISEVLSWKFNDQPGIKTQSGTIVEFPGDMPSKADLDAWRVEYEASNAYKLHRLRQDPLYQKHVQSRVIEALLEKELGNPAPLDNILAKWTQLKTDYGL